MSSQHSVLIGDGHKLFIEGLTLILQSEFNVAGATLDGHELVRVACALKPDVVLVNLSIPLVNGIDITRKLRAALPNTRFVILSSRNEPEFVVSAFEAGANAYVLMSESADQFLGAVRQAILGERYVTASLRGLLRGRAWGHRKRTGLTTREREVLKLVAEGKSAKEIAWLLGMSVKTVAFHKNSIFDALRMRTTAQLTRYAIESGICASVSPDRSQGADTPRAAA